ncbi:protein-L-isoaspartate(D-aspartate) O-methyltransferase [Vineibacter terrae]|uniref:protein-L-isoaspartate(D-aspartate) O-methyltransferase n=1 Tax=Vineibacter terrae TaxID=2586908 RepID=UPI002E3009EC|nr:protein-L-isoaspartate(D-aspartate) O-methyltransferase [Vineibacter terrae]HEX2890194.1 protein-L-isoaspartate(D-aspartate) O-methyltransferase [Vineibacter terrae]
MSVAKQRLITDLQRGGITDERVLAVMASIPREAFVSRTFVERAYDNMALPIGFGQTISQPQVVAAMTQALDIGARMKVLEIGTGSGYQAAILARLARRVFTIERYKMLSRDAERRLLDLRVHNVVFHVGDGTKGWPPQAPYDRIIVTAAAGEMPMTLVDQLAVGGIMLVPVGPDPVNQTVERVVKTEHGITREELMPVRFVPLVAGALPTYEA